MIWESYTAFKEWLLPVVGLSRDALHIHVGLIVYFTTALLFRKRLHHWLPWTIAAVAAFGGEAWDIYDRAAIGVAADPAAHWHDIRNTLFWPSVMTIAAWLRWRIWRSADGGEQPLE